MWLERVMQQSISIFVKYFRAVCPRAIDVRTPGVQGVFVERTFFDRAETWVLVWWVKLCTDKYPEGQRSTAENADICTLGTKGRKAR